MQNEIEEIAKTIFDYVGSKGQKHVYVLGNDTAKEMREYSHNQGIAEVLYNAGYRKQSEVAKDILESIYLWLGEDFEEKPDNGFIPIMKKDFVRDMKYFAKKYEVELEVEE